MRHTLSISTYQQQYYQQILHQLPYQHFIDFWIKMAENKHNRMLKFENGYSKM